MFKLLIESVHKMFNMFKIYNKKAKQKEQMNKI